MCGRFVVYSAGEQLRDLLGLNEAPDLSPRYNVAVGTSIPAALQSPQGHRELRPLHWGLVPPWAKDRKFGHRCFNARSESAHEKPAFRKAFVQRRCLIPANGFFEWLKRGKAREPWYFHMAHERPFAFAGLWERFEERGADGATSTLHSCTILTVPPNELVEPFHDRMPVILDPEHFDAWLDPQHHDVERLRAMLVPCSAEHMAAHAVSPEVNKVRSKGPGLIAPYTEAQGSLF